MKILFLDDDDSRFQEFRHRTGLNPRRVQTWPGFYDAIMGEPWDLIMLDHDLGDNNFDGAVAAKFLADNPLVLNGDQQIIIHSANPIGVANMLSHMKYADHLRVNVVHFAWNKARYSSDTGLSFSFLPHD